jgi:sec-independent protein translocase protein TatC
MAETEIPTAEINNRPGLLSMGFMEHLEELRKRIIWSFVSIAAGFSICYFWHKEIFAWIQKPIVTVLSEHKMSTQLVYTNPVDPFNMYLKISLIAGIFLASPFILYQVWAFIAPGLYKSERRYAGPFMVSTVGLFMAGGLFAYKMVYPAALSFLVQYSLQFTPMITINEYINLFMTIVLGLGVIFELPILVFFLALFGIITPGWMWRNIRYAILGIFIVAAAIAPTPDILSMCTFAAPMLVLYVFSIGVAYVVHPRQRKTRELKGESE